MCCKMNHTENHFCSCQGNAVHHPEMWSKKKKISVLNDYLVSLEKQVEDIREALNELQG